MSTDLASGLGFPRLVRSLGSKHMYAVGFMQILAIMICMYLKILTLSTICERST